MKKLLALLATALLITSCETAPAGFTPEPFDFGSKQPIRLNVAEVRLVETYQSPMRAPSVDQDFAVPPASALKLWVKERLLATGTSGVLEISIDDASVKEAALPRTKGIKGIFTEDQDSRYSMNVHVTMRAFNGTDSMSTASGDVSIARSRTVSEKATVEDRQRLFDQMNKEMMASFDAQATTRLNQYFGSFLAR